MEKGANIAIENRERLVMSAVSEVLSFDEDFVAVSTPLGKVEIEGKELKILQMSSDSGDLLVAGRIDGVFYAAKPSLKKGFFSRSDG